MNTMSLHVCLVGLLMVLIHLSGCATPQRQRMQGPVQEGRAMEPTTPPTTPSPVEPRTEPLPQVSPPPVAAPVSPSSQAVVALLDTADARAQAGNLDSAAAVLERALRLEPQNPLLWHRLAALRLQQGQYAQAVSLAAKSNALASHNRQLQADNWDLIARAKENLGEADAARAAREKARTLH